MYQMSVLIACQQLPSTLFPECAAVPVVPAYTSEPLIQILLAVVRFNTYTDEKAVIEHLQTQFLQGGPASWADLHV